MSIEKCPKCGEEYDPMYSDHKCKGELSFWWGYLWIAAHIFFGIIVSIFVIFGICSGELVQYLSDRGINLTEALLQTGFGIILSISGAIGLLKRKKWGLCLVFAEIGLVSLNRVISLIKGDELLISGVIPLFIAYLWFTYFFKRRGWFK